MYKGPELPMESIPRLQKKWLCEKSSYERQACVLRLEDSTMAGGVINQM